MDNSHFKLSDADNAEMNPESNMHELEMEYIQVLNTNSDTNSDSELQNLHPNFIGKYTKPSKAKN